MESMSKKHFNGFHSSKFVTVENHWIWPKTLSDSYAFINLNVFLINWFLVSTLIVVTLTTGFDTS